MGGREASISESNLPLSISRQLNSCTTHWPVGGASVAISWMLIVCCAMSCDWIAPPFERLAVVRWNGHRRELPAQTGCKTVDGVRLQVSPQRHDWACQEGSRVTRGVSDQKKALLLPLHTLPLRHTDQRLLEKVNLAILVHLLL
ncbi:hypothetical protein RRG08_040966 [Elysia crispata]|uniref:Uncharacterized protein n=1 Tax=Elysia crispata TaxID=231223 RepID=A0AAE1AMT1_9GAST|nr:hypothetical protein RRG08_040966 [Elysia crispata]